MYDALNIFRASILTLTGCELLEEPVVLADETRWPLLGSPGASRWHAWALATSNGVFYEIDNTRGLKGGRALLAGYAGIAVTDGYAVYDALEKKMPVIA